jgi:hypothetical protein
MYPIPVPNSRITLLVASEVPLRGRTTVARNIANQPSDAMKNPKGVPNAAMSIPPTVGAITEADAINDPLIVTALFIADLGTSEGKYACREG